MTPSHRFVLVSAAIFLCAGAPRPWAVGPDPPDVDALLQHLDDLYRSRSSVARIEIAVTTPRSTRNMRLRAWTRGEEEVLVLIEAPPREAGTATLRVGNNLWNYLPKIARTIRVRHPQRCSDPGWGPTSRTTTWSRSLHCGRISPRGSTADRKSRRDGG